LKTEKPATYTAAKPVVDVLEISLPDWQWMDTALRDSLPFALWTVGDQPLVYHWLDYAVNEGYRKVRIRCADRPTDVRRAMEEATLWPVKWEVIPVIETSIDDSGEFASRLPWRSAPTAMPEDGWALLDYWLALEEQWFDSSFEATVGADLALGRLCSVHPTAKITMPVWIGNNVYIGPGSEVGPHATIGDGSILQGNNRVIRSKVSADTFLGANTELDRCYLDGGVLLNLRYRVVVPIDEVVAHTTARPLRPGLCERAVAFVLWGYFRFFGGRSKRDGESFTTLQGLELARADTACPVWEARLPWLLQTVRGKLHLFGVLPRSVEDIKELSDEWQDMIRAAQPGVFSYADTHGCHAPGNEVEAVHAVYEAAQDEAEIAPICRRYLWDLVKTAVRGAPPREASPDVEGTAIPALVPFKPSSDLAPPDSVALVPFSRTEIPAKISAVPLVREPFLDFLHYHGVPEADVMAWTLSFTEAVTNAIRHGCGSDAELQVQIEWWREEDEFCLAVSDPGSGISDDALKNPMLPEDPTAEGGRGLYVIGELSDFQEHWRGPNGYRLVLRRSVPGLPQPTGANPEMESPELDSLLEELSSSYESLAAYSEMGAALVSAGSQAEFFANGLESLAFAQQEPPDLLLIVLSETVAMSQRNELRHMDAILTPKTAPPFAIPVLEGGEGITWRSRKEVVGDPILGEFGCGSCFPIVASGQTLGCLIAAKRRERPLFQTGELNNLRTFADLFGISLANGNLQVARENEQRAFREMEIATEIQRSLLPVQTPPVSDDWKLHMKHRSAFEVAGDYLEATHDPDGNLFLAVIDVMGKGVSAAMLAALFRSGFHMQLQQSPSLADLAGALNEALCHQLGDLSLFVTATLVRIDRDHQTLEIANAGHCPAILFQGAAGSERREIVSSGPPFGLFENEEYPVETIPLVGGEALLLVTDGLYEWSDGTSPEWGWENLAELAANEVYSDPEGFWTGLQKRIKEAALGGSATDDQTMLFWKLDPR